MNKTFGGLKLKGFLLEGLKQMGIYEPTPVQSQVIPAVVGGRDVIGRSQTGTGKTLAYALPLLQMIDLSKSELQVLVLAPTRELIRQIGGVIDGLRGNEPVDVVSVHGGVDLDRHIQKLKRHPQVIIGTPGRILDLIEREALAAHTVRHLVADEADTMLEMGFRNEIEKILQRVKKDTQILFFAATLPDKALEMARSVMKKPVFVNINPEERTLPAIENVIYRVRPGSKADELLKLIKLSNPYLGIVFVKKKEQVDDLAAHLRTAGIPAEGLHGDMQRGQRKQVLQRFREARSQVLVATDIASRGLDIEAVTHIFNFDPPISVDQYIHRIGRTGRAGETGVAINLVSPGEEQVVARIAEKLGRPFQEKIAVKDLLVDKPIRQRTGSESREKALPAAGKAKAKPKRFTGPNAKKKAAKEAQKKIAGAAPKKPGRSRTPRV